MSELDHRALLVKFRVLTIGSLFAVDVKKHDPLAGRQIHALHLDRGKH